MNQHYVPKCYLRNFATQRKKDFYVDVYDKEVDDFFYVNIKKICGEIDFYTLDEDSKVSEDALAVEKIYSNFIEPKYIKAFEILTDDSILHINENQRADILIGIIQLYTRNPSFLIKMLEHNHTEVLRLCTDSKQKGIKGITYLDEDFSFRDFTENEIVKIIKAKTIQQFKEEHLSITQEIVKFHAEAKFEVNIINDDSCFFTSDNPLTLSDSISSNQHPLLRTTEFVITLSRKYALKIFHDKGKELNQLYKCHIGNGCTFQINNKILNQSMRFVMTDKENLEKYKELKLIFDDTSFETKVGIFNQILEKFSHQKETKKQHELIESFLKKHRIKETTKEEQSIFLNQLLLEGRKIMKQRAK